MAQLPSDCGVREVIDTPSNNCTLPADTGYYRLTGAPVTLRIIPGLQLNPSGPFYRFVMTYLAASAGLTPVYDSGNYPNFMRATGGIFPGAYVGDVSVILGDCVAEARNGQPSQRDAEIALCCMLANTAYESVKHIRDTRFSTDPEFEVFRHVRNAASHGNKWHFGSSEPKCRAQWRGFVIDDITKGVANTLHDSSCFYGSIMPADLLYLLGDIEKVLARP